MANFPLVETGYKPEGALGGWYAGENAAFQEQMQPMMLLDQLYKMQNQEMVNDRYLQETPNVIAESNLKRAQAGVQNTPEMLRMFGLGKQGEYQKTQAEGQIAQDTRDSTIGNKNAENKLKTTQSDIGNKLSAMEAYIASGGNTFLLNGSGYSPELLTEISGLAKSGQLPIVLDQLKKQLADSVGTRSKVIETEATGKWHKEQQGMQDAAAMKRLQAQIDAGIYKRGSGASMKVVLSKLPPKTRLGQVQNILTTGIDPETGEALTDMARLGYEAMYTQDAKTVDAENQARKAGAVDIPAVANLPGVSVPSVGKDSSQPGGKPKASAKDF